MGFIIIAISLFELISVASAFLYIIFYTLLMFIIFILDNITSLYIFFNKNILLSIIFSFTLLSLAGLPFFMGFFSKLYILLALISYGYFFIVVILLFFNILITIYYIRLIRFTLFSEERNYKIYKIYYNIKILNILYSLMLTLFFFNILILFYHNYLLLFILNNIIVFF